MQQRHGAAVISIAKPPPLAGILFPIVGARRAGMPRSPTPTAFVLLAVTVCGCGAAIEPPTSGSVPVIQTLLVAGDSQQIAWVEWRVHPDSTFGPEVRPVDPSLVEISLILPTGSSVPFTPSPNIPGRFEAAALVSPAMRYRMAGAVAGFALAAETTVPDTLFMRVPARDTIAVVACVESFIYCELPYSWSARGATNYVYFQAQGDPLLLSNFRSTRDSTGIMLLLPDTGTGRLTVLALEDNAAAFLTPRTPKSSVRGVFGMFGAATRVERWIIWP